jgi:hypothetical protein
LHLGKSREPASVFAVAGPGWGEPAFMGGDGGRTPARACRISHQMEVGNGVLLGNWQMDRRFQMMLQPFNVDVADHRVRAFEQRMLR